MPPTPDRMDALQRFIADALGGPSPAIEPASADASFRSYWRTRATDGTHCIVMDAPPDKENIGPWLDVAARLRGAGLHVPAVLAADTAGGFVLMEDLGDRTYLPELTEDTVDALYADALDALLRMQTRADTRGLPVYDRARLVAEMELLPPWFLKRHLGFAPDCDEWDVIEAAFTLLVQAALEQPRAFVHRDYHSRNLLVVKSRQAGIGLRRQDAGANGEAGPQGESRTRRVNRESEQGQAGAVLASPGTIATGLLSPGIIDFQDAVAGPVTYDLVSLLRDCYIEWDTARVEAWVEGHRQRLHRARLIGTDVDTARFQRWFDLMGLQRHLKVLGIFCRLWYRDGKAQYLGDLALVWRYTITVARRYPELADFAALLERALGDSDLTQARAETTA